MPEGKAWMGKLLHVYDAGCAAIESSVPDRGRRDKDRRLEWTIRVA